jgi:phenylalanyl-tRNA synthetase beta subunit
VRREIDLVEEVARFHLEEVPPTLPVRRELFGRLTREQRLRRLVADVLVGGGFFEAYTYSLQADDPTRTRSCFPSRCPSCRGRSARRCSTGSWAPHGTT